MNNPKWPSQMITLCWDESIRSHTQSVKALWVIDPFFRAPTPVLMLQRQPKVETKKRESPGTTLHTYMAKSTFKFGRQVSKHKFTQEGVFPRLKPSFILYYTQ